MKTLSPAGRFSLLRVAALTACVALAILTARADDWAPNLTFQAGWNNNASNADAPNDQIDGFKLTGDLLASQRYAYGRDDTVHAALHLAGDWWPRFNGLTSGAVGARGEWRHKIGTNALAPTFSIEAAADALAAKESERRGVSTGITVAVRKRFNDLTRGTLAHEVSWFDARPSTFDRAASETTAEIDRDLTDVTRLTFTARFRDGDVVSYATPPRPDLDAIAPHRLGLGTFGRTMTAYRVDARTWSARVAVSHALNQNSAVVVGYEWRDTRRQPLSFVNNMLSVAFVHQY